MAASRKTPQSTSNSPTIILELMTPTLCSPAKNTFAFISSLDRLRLAMPHARIVICVRNPWDTIASWKTSFEHLYKADLSIRPVGNPRDPWLAPASQRQLAEIETITDLPVRRARLWAYLAERVLADRNHILVRYEDLATDPLGQLARILDGLPVGTLREPIEPGRKSSAAKCSTRATMTP